MSKFKELFDEVMSEKDYWEKTGKSALVHQNDKIISDILDIGSGTFGNQFNINKYNEIEKYKNDVILFIQNSKNKFKSWVDAIKNFKKFRGMNEDKLDEGKFEKIEEDITNAINKGIEVLGEKQAGMVGAMIKSAIKKSNIDKDTLKYIKF